MNDIFKGHDGSNTPLVTVFFGANDAARPMPDGNKCVMLLNILLVILTGPLFLQSLLTTACPGGNLS